MFSVLFLYYLICCCCCSRKCSSILYSVVKLLKSPEKKSQDHPEERVSSYELVCDEVTKIQIEFYRCQNDFRHWLHKRIQIESIMENGGSCLSLFETITSSNYFGVNRVWKLTHHTKGEGVAGFRHGQTLDHLRSHPWKRAHQGHVRCVRQELRCPKVTDLRHQ